MSPVWVLIRPNRSATPPATSRPIVEALCRTSQRLAREIIKIPLTRSEQQEEQRWYW